MSYGARVIAFDLGYLIFVIIWLYVGASIIAFGLGYPMFAIVSLYVIWREYHCLWPGLYPFRDPMAVRGMAPV